MIVEKLREHFKPDFMAVAWDVPGKTFRHEKYSAYKATRPKKEQELYDQIPIIKSLLEAFRIPSVEAVGFEADDVIGTLSKQAERKGCRTLIVTGDLDALQLVSDRTHVVFFQKGISETKTYDVAAIQERYRLTPAQLIDYKALRGDPSDNIPGVSGIGEKTATVLIQKYESIKGLFAALKKGDIEASLAKKIEGTESIASEARELVEIVRDVKLPIRFSQTAVKEPDWNQVLSQYEQLEFRTLLRKHGQKDEAKTTGKNKAVEIVRDAEELSNKLSRMKETIGFHLADKQADLFGSTHAALAISDGILTLVIPNPAEKHIEIIQQKFKGVSTVVVHDLKRLMHVLPSLFVSHAFRFFDIMIASYLLHSGSRAHDLHSVISKELEEKVAELPTSYASTKDYERLGQVVSCLHALATKLTTTLHTSALFSVFEDIELPLVSVLYEMEKTGVMIDTEALAVFSSQLKKRLASLEKKIHESAHTEFNVQSPIQLAHVLFEVLKLPTKGIKKTKTGYSTAAPELEKLWDAHEIIPLISEHRELAKLQSTYVETLPKLVDQDGRVHTTYNQTVTATGRLSSSDPNLQNIPIKTELGREIRKAFIAPKAKRLLAADYSQIELRLIAVIAKDQPFISAFQAGADIHTRTASEVWEIEEKKVTPEQRRAAKAINFGILYGMGPRSLSRSTGLSLTQAKEFIDRYFEIHHTIQAYLDETKIKAHQDGYVETLFGRRRYLPEIHSGVPMLISQAERMAINMPVQGTAADLMKKAMLAVHGWLQKSELPAAMLLQVHDELVFEVKKEALEVVMHGIKEMMEGVATFEVPLVVDLEVGSNWGEMETL